MMEKIRYIKKRRSSIQTHLCVPTRILKSIFAYSIKGLCDGYASSIGVHVAHR